MKTGITAEGPGLDSKISSRFGQSEYLLVWDSETRSIEVIHNKTEEYGRQQGMQMVILALSHKIGTVLTGYISPNAEKYLEQNGIKVVSGISGSASLALENFRQDEQDIKGHKGPDKKPEKKDILSALKKSFKQFSGLLPVMFGVVLLIGLFKTFLTRELISGFFTGKIIPDTFLGSCLGSILAGNPINSYVIGKELLDRGVSFFGVTAFMTAWVTVGLVHLPMEITALGKNFTLKRNLLAFIFSLLTAFFTAGTYYLVKGGAL